MVDVHAESVLNVFVRTRAKYWNSDDLRSVKLDKTRKVGDIKRDFTTHKVKEFYHFSPNGHVVELMDDRPLAVRRARGSGCFHPLK